MNTSPTSRPSVDVNHKELRARTAAYADFLHGLLLFSSDEGPCPEPLRAAFIQTGDFRGFDWLTRENQNFLAANPDDADSITVARSHFDRLLRGKFLTDDQIAAGDTLFTSLEGDEMVAEIAGKKYSRVAGSIEIKGSDSNSGLDLGRIRRVDGDAVISNFWFMNGNLALDEVTDGLIFGECGFESLTIDARHLGKLSYIRPTSTPLTLLSLPHLVECGELRASSTDKLYLPKLERIDTLVAGSASEVLAPKLKHCGTAQLPKDCRFTNSLTPYLPAPPEAAYFIQTLSRNLRRCEELGVPVFLDAGKAMMLEEKIALLQNASGPSAVDLDKGSRLTGPDDPLSRTR
jgi:hypothetical protein